MSVEAVIILYNKYKNLYPSSDLIIFYNCSTQLKNLFNNNEFLKTYIATSNNTIVFEYNTSRFHTANALYRFIVNSVQPEYVESFTCKQYTDVQHYTIVHKNVQAELQLCNDGTVNFTVAMEKIVAENFINFNYLCTMENVYDFMIRYIDAYVL